MSHPLRVVSVGICRPVCEVVAVVHVMKLRAAILQTPVATTQVQYDGGSECTLHWITGKIISVLRSRKNVFPLPHWRVHLTALLWDYSTGVVLILREQAFVSLDGLTTFSCYRCHTHARLTCSFSSQISISTRVEEGSNTSTVTLRVVGGDEKGSLKCETVKYGLKS
jgi:hypothetical protein